MSTATDPEPAVSREDVESFLALEAHLLDTRAYDDWLELWAPTSRYLVPGGPGADEHPQVALIDDDRATLEDRVFRMKHPASHALDPPPKAVRLVGNAVIELAEGAAIEARSAYLLVVNRQGDQTVYAARQHHRLIERDGRLEILLKRVDLTCSEDPIRNLTFLP